MIYIILIHIILIVNAERLSALFFTSFKQFLIDKLNNLGILILRMEGSMLLKLLKKIIFLCSIIFSIQIQSYIHKIEIYNKNKFFLLGDIHLGMNERFSHPTLSNEELFKIHEKQAINLINFIKKYDTKDCLIITEDFFDIAIEKYKKAFNDARTKYLENNFSAIFDFIDKLSKENNIRLINAEFRQVSVLFFDFGKITAEEFLISFEKTIQEFSNYNDTSYLNDYYKNFLNTFLNKHKVFIDILKNNKNKYINEINYQQELKKNFINDYFKLLDLKIIHIIYQNNNTKHIFLCAGSNHTLRIKDLLNQIGFVCTASKENSYEKPLNIRNTLKNLTNEIILPSNDININKLLLLFIIISDIIIKIGYVLFKRQKTKSRRIS